MRPRPGPRRGGPAAGGVAAREPRVDRSSGEPGVPALRDREPEHDEGGIVEPEHGLGRLLEPPLAPEPAEEQHDLALGWQSGGRPDEIRSLGRRVPPFLAVE